MYKRILLGILLFPIIIPVFIMKCFIIFICFLIFGTEYVFTGKYNQDDGSW